MSIIGTSVSVLSHGWPGLTAAFAAVQGPMLVGMMQRRASISRLLASPVLAAPVTVAGGTALTLSAPMLHSVGVTAGGMLQWACGIAASGAAGYATGRRL